MIDSYVLNTPDKYNTGKINMQDFFGKFLLKIGGYLYRSEKNGAVQFKMAKSGDGMDRASGLLYRSVILNGSFLSFYYASIL